MPAAKKIAYVRESVLEAMITEGARKAPLETGGVLMGYWAVPQRAIVIEHMIGPGPSAKHSVMTFKPDTGWQKVKIAKIYKASSRYHTYLGDWHSHPNGSSDLSMLDLQTLRRISTYKKARSPYPIMGLITGVEKNELSVWCLEMQSEKIPKRQMVTKFTVVIAKDDKRTS